MTLYLRDPDVELHHGDALAVLAGLPAESVHCVVTSPPYWGLRDYRTGAWEAPALSKGEGQEALRALEGAGERQSPSPSESDWTTCDHVVGPARQDQERETPGGRGGSFRGGNILARDVCGKCGARRVDNQLGLEPTPELYVEHMVTVFREVRRVLRRDGTCWLNIGDSYASSSTYNTTNTLHTENGWKQDSERRPNVRAGDGLKPKDLVGIPWRLAFALQADGWWLRADIIWSKPNPMPESVTDRPTKAHEYVFLLTRSPRYFFDQEAVREPAEWARWGDQTVGPGSNPDGWIKPRPKDHFRNSAKYVEQGQAPSNSDHAGDRGEARGFDPTRGRNVRSVWEIATQPYPEAHFATFPEELVRRCVLAGTSERGACPECGAPWERVVDVTRSGVARSAEESSNGAAGPKEHTGYRGSASTSTIGWRPSCECMARLGAKLPEVPCTVLDPFVGSGTVPLIARQLGRRSIGVDLNADYLALAKERLATWYKRPRVERRDPNSPQLDLLAESR